ncbi:MAG: hypothetical protein H0W72_09510 [Planctomycetes bacterium]|nr:hypothetical protein [Planctomycetota bacterium]
MVIIDARDDGALAEVAVTYGPDASSASILCDGDGVAVFRQQLNRNVALYTCSSGGGPLRPAIGSVGWMYQYDTGLTAAAAVATLRAACIGTAADRLITAGYAAGDVDVIAERAGLGTRDARLRLAIEVAPSGLLATQPWSR